MSMICQIFKINQLHYNTNEVVLPLRIMLPKPRLIFDSRPDFVFAGFRVGVR